MFNFDSVDLFMGYFTGTDTVLLGTGFVLCKLVSFFDWIWFLASIMLCADAREYFYHFYRH